MMSARKTTKDARTETLEKLVRRFIGIVNHLPTFVADMALLNAENPDWLKNTKSRGSAELCEGHNRLVELIAEANRLADGEWNAEKLQAMVRRFISFVNCLPPHTSVGALLDAEKPEWRDMATDEQCMNFEVNDGYRMLSRLMSMAYDAIGDEEDAG